jgi:hypothetical protein
MRATWDKVLLFSFSIVLIVCLIFVIFRQTDLNEQQWYVCISVLALGAAGFAAFLPGSISWQVNPGLKAGGAFAVLLLVFWFGRQVKQPVKIEAVEVKDWPLETTPTPGDPGPNAYTATIYVNVDDHIVARQGAAVDPPWLKVSASEVLGSVGVERGQGGLTVTIDRIGENRKVYFLVYDNNQWWMSDDVRTPPGVRTSLRLTSVDTVRKRVQ